MEKRIFVYADESGNSGRNIFDSRSEYFYQGGIISYGDIESSISPIIEEFCIQYNIERLHACELGEITVIKICEKLLTVMKKYEWSFSCTIVEKNYLPAIKFVDTFFDFVDNRAVPSYWLKSEKHRHLLCLAIFHLMESDLGEQFWESLTTQNIKEARKVCEKILDRNQRMYKTNVSDIIDICLQSALNEISRFAFFSKKEKSSYKSHTPNMIGFFNLVSCAHSFCEKNNASAYSFIHDLNDEFKGVMRKHLDSFKKMHIYSQEGFFNVKQTRHDLGTFDLESSKNNKSLQVVDLILWLIQRKGDNSFISSEIKTELESRINLFKISRSNSMRILQHS